MASTTRDLARWGYLYGTGAAIPESWRTAHRHGVPAPRLGPESRYGLGLIIRKTSQGLAYGHSGFMPGYRSEMYYYPERQMAAALQIKHRPPATTPRIDGVVPRSNGRARTRRYRVPRRQSRR